VRGSRWRWNWGAGDGSFLVEYAACHPERNFIGCGAAAWPDPEDGPQGQRAGLSNLRGVRIESSYFLGYLLPDHSAEALHVYFPDPWRSESTGGIGSLTQLFRRLPSGPSLRADGCT